ncbi:hypothetical protein BC830DRAFT_1136998 [Chytriomyces sp. MP71]|nr:hypothetical protein BC830DRAFT_1136998 [Chytriomyces sp. MP71]
MKAALAQWLTTASRPVVHRAPNSGFQAAALRRLLCDIRGVECNESPLLSHFTLDAEANATALHKDGYDTLYSPPEASVKVAHRMWVGGRVSFSGPSDPSGPGSDPSGSSETDGVDDIDIHARVTKVEEKSSGAVFVWTERLLKNAQSHRTLITDSRTHFYKPSETQRTSPMIKHVPLPNVEFTFATPTFDTSPTSVFQYSAITFNSHRIHYDVDYCRNVEKYPDLLVHGPLTATLALDSARDALRTQLAPSSVRIHAFEYKAVSPLLVHTPFRVCGVIRQSAGSDPTQPRIMEVWVVRGTDDGVVMECTVEFSQSNKKTC